MSAVQGQGGRAPWWQRIVPPLASVPMHVKLAGFVAATMVVTCGSLLAVSYLAARHNLRQQIDDRLGLAAGDRQIILNDYIERQTDRIGILASSPALNQIAGKHLAAGAAAPELERQSSAILESMLWRIQDIAVMDLIGLDGVILASTDQQRIGQSRADDVVFQRALQGEAYLGFLQSIDDKYVVAVAAPVVAMDDPRPKAVLRARLDATELVHQVIDSTAVGRTAEIQIGVSRAGRLIPLTPSQEPAWQIQMTAENAPGMTRALQGQAGLLHVTSPRGLDYLVAYRPVGYDKWGLVVRIEEEEAYEPIIRLGRFLLLALFLFVMGGVMLSYLISRHFTGPLELLSHTAEDISRGNLEAKVPNHRGDEIGRLGETFNQMTQSLRQSRAALEHARDTLEQNVQQRTAELRQSQEELQTKNTLMESILESISEGVIVEDLERRFLIFNPPARDMLGSGPMGLPPPDRAKHYGLFHLNQSNAFNSNELLQAIVEGRSNSVDIEFFVRNENVPQGRYLSASARPLQDTAGRRQGVVIVLRDITQARQAREALRESEERFRTIFEKGPLGMAVVGTDSRFVQVNDTLCRMLGYTAQELISLQFNELVDAEGNRLEERLVQQLLRGEISDYHLEKRYRRKDGEITWVWLTASLIRAPDGTPLYSLAMLVDINEQKRTEAALKESEERYALAVKGTTDGLWDWHIREEHIYYSPRFKELLGYQGLEFPDVIDSVLQHTHSGDRFRLVRAMTKQVRQRKGFDLEVRLRTASGQYRWFRARGEAVHDAQGVPIRMAGSISDVTQRRQAEEQVRDLNVHLEQQVAQRTMDLLVANRELEAFNYSVSHDLRGPLRSIDGFCQLLVEECGQGLSSDCQNYIVRIRAGAQRIGQIIDSLLELSRATRAQIRRENVNASEVVARVLQELQRRDPQRKVETVITPDVHLHAEPRLLQQALENLLSNAWKFTAKKEQARIEFGVTEREGKTVYFVRDNGAGFDMRFVDKLFRPFQRLHGTGEFEGAGIGLATVYRIIDRHGGKVWAEGKVNQGATFYFTL